MKDTYSLVFEALKIAKNRNLDSRDTALLITQQLYQQRKQESSDLEQVKNLKNLSNSLNVVLIKIIRDIFSLRNKSKYEQLFRIGALNSTQGLKELQEHWNEFYKNKNYTKIQQTLTNSLLKAFNLGISQNPAKLQELIAALTAHPENLSDLDFLERINEALQSKKELEIKELEHVVELSHIFFMQLLSTKINEEYMSAPKNPFSEQKNRAGLYELCELWRKECQNLNLDKYLAKYPQIKTTALSPTITSIKPLKKPKTFTLNQAPINTNQAQEKEHFEPVQEEEKDLLPLTIPMLEAFNALEVSPLCVIRLKNHQNIFHSFGQSGYVRVKNMLRLMFAEKMQAFITQKDVFEPCEGVFYLLVKGDMKEITRTFDVFLHSLSTQVFNFREQKEVLKFEGRIFEKNDLEGLQELQDFIRGGASTQSELTKASEQ